MLLTGAVTGIALAATATAMLVMVATGVLLALLLLLMSGVASWRLRLLLRRIVAALLSVLRPLMSLVRLFRLLAAVIAIGLHRHHISFLKMEKGIESAVIGRFDCVDGLF